ncbi:MAG TPA: GNAT family N-acetyltransferase [Tepidisphaeraceae bacterium]|jgi:phosphinothricin acetyltransferase|nr:GNAT family N-acetyltransferase [Tepidisphaeraceae bacterium]
MDGLDIRPAIASDLLSINEIYNHYVGSSTATYQTRPMSLQERAAWFAKYDGLHPVIVAERDGRIVGWASLGEFHKREAFRNTVESSIYVRHDQRRLGIGKALLAELIQQARVIGHHTIIASIDSEQSASIVLHEHAGFARVGRLHQVGYKFGRWLDVIYMQMML